jgi:hypothetical protein
MNPLVAGTSWPDAAIAIAGIGLLAVAVYSIFAVGRTAVGSSGDAKATELAERVDGTLAQLGSDVADVRERLTEVERLLKDV